MLGFLSLSKRIPKWVNLRAAFSSVYSSRSIEISPEIDQNPLSSPEFEAKVQSLRKSKLNPDDFEVKIQYLRSDKLNPDCLIKVLHRTTDINSVVRIFKWASLQKGFVHTVDTYYCVILKLGMAGNVKEMEGFCQSMIRDRCPDAEKVLVSLIHSFVRECRPIEAIRILFNMNLGGYKPKVEVINSVLGALVEGKRDFQEVVFVYKEMVKAGVVPTVDTLNFLLEVLFETGRVDYALDQYRRMNKKGCSPNSRTFEIVIKGLIAKNRVDESIVVLHEMFELGCSPELSFYTCVIPLFCRENKLEEGSQLYRMMIASNCQLDSHIYEALIECLCKNLLLDDAVSVVEDMIGSSLMPGDHFLEDVINCFCQLGKINEATKFLKDKHVNETRPHNALLRGCCGAGNYAAAKDLFDEMWERKIVDCDSWNILGRWLCEKAEMRRAYELVGRMIVSSFIPDCAMCSALVIGHCRSKKYEDALQLFHKLVVKYWLLDSVSYSELIEGLCEVRKYQDAMDVFCYMSKNKCSLQSFSFDVLIKGVCSVGMISEAMRLQFLGYSSGTSCSNAASNCVMLELSKSENGKYLFPFLSQLHVKGYNIDAEAYCILIQGMIAENQLKDCVLFFNTMVNKGLLPDSDTLNNILSCLANHSQLYLISPAILKLDSDFHILDSAMYSILINGFWKEGNENEAHRLLDSMLERGWIPDAATHRLLIHSSNREQIDQRMSTCEECKVKDDVSHILAEGLDKM